MDIHTTGICPTNILPNRYFPNRHLWILKSVILGIWKSSFAMFKIFTCGVWNSSYMLQFLNLWDVKFFICGFRISSFVGLQSELVVCGFPVSSFLFLIFFICDLWNSSFVVGFDFFITPRKKWFLCRYNSKWSDLVEN